MFVIKPENLTFNLLDDESARRAIEIVGDTANRNGIEWALAGGLALILYGSNRLTREVDIVASRTLPMPSQGLLKQGGVRYIVPTAKKEVAVDWIIRNDEALPFYRAALNEAVIIDGIPVLKPEWLFILKFIAGAVKNQEDYKFLLGCPNLVDRLKVKKLILQVGGNETWAVMKNGLQHWYDAVDGRYEYESGWFIDS